MNRCAILLAAGDKSGAGEKRFYRQLIEKAERLESETRLSDRTAGMSDREELSAKLNDLIYIYLELRNPTGVVQALERLGLIDTHAIASAQVASILSTAGAIFAQNRQFEQAGAAFLKALHIAGETLARLNPRPTHTARFVKFVHNLHFYSLFFVRHTSYIILYSRCEFFSRANGQQ